MLNSSREENFNLAIVFRKNRTGTLHPSSIVFHNLSLPPLSHLPHSKYLNDYQAFRYLPKREKQTSSTNTVLRETASSMAYTRVEFIIF